MVNSNNNTKASSTFVIPYLEVGTIIGIAIASYCVACWVGYFIYDYFYGHIRQVLQQGSEQRIDRRSATSASTNSNLSDPAENDTSNSRVLGWLFRSQARPGSTNSRLEIAAVPTPIRSGSPSPV